MMAVARGRLNELTWAKRKRVADPDAHFDAARTLRWWCPHAGSCTLSAAEGRPLQRKTQGHGHILICRAALIAIRVHCVGDLTNRTGAPDGSRVSGLVNYLLLDNANHIKSKPMQSSSINLGGNGVITHLATSKISMLCTSPACHSVVVRCCSNFGRFHRRTG